MHRLLSLSTIIAFFLLAGLAKAGQMQIAPVLIDVAAPSASDSVKIANTGKESITIQARLFGWHQQKKKDSYYRTKNVVVSPPLLKLAPGKSGVVRIVRLSKKPIRGEESYRLIVDELPKPARAGRSAVSMVMRHSIPVFFSGANTAVAKPSWSVIQRQGKLYVKATNPGDTRVKLSALALTDAKGNRISFGNGLTGYILGKSSRHFVTNARKRLRGTRVRLTAKSNMGAINKSVQLKN